MISGREREMLVGGKIRIGKGFMKNQYMERDIPVTDLGWPILLPVRKAFAPSPLNVSLQDLTLLGLRAPHIWNVGRTRSEILAGSASL